MNTPNAAVELMRDNLRRHPEKTAYICRDRSLTYHELSRLSHCFAHLLRRRNIAPGDRVAIALPDCFAFPAAFLGCLLTGAIAVAAGSAQRDENLEHIITDSGALLLISHREHSSLHASFHHGAGHIVCDDYGPLDDESLAGHSIEPFRPRKDDFAYMLYSSGSTGKPKGIPHRHASLLLPCELMGRQVLGLTSSDLIFSTSKLSFCYGLINSLSFPLHFGATAILHPGKPDVGVILDIIKKHEPSVFFSVPSVFRYIALSCGEPHLKLPLRLCCSAGETLPASLFKEWQRLTGLELLDGIGASELSHHFISNVPGQARAGSAGKVVPGYLVRLVDDHGIDVPSGVEGNLLVCGETRAPHYWNLPEKSRMTMLTDGYTRTGDIFLERDSYYYFRGRSDDMIKVDAQWVSPVMVEDTLRGHHLVEDCAVVEVTLGGLAKPGAYVVLSSGTERKPGLALELMAYVKTRLPEHMCPARFRFLDELPRTSTGKIKRSLLRESIHRATPSSEISE